MRLVGIALGLALLAMPTLPSCSTTGSGRRAAIPRGDAVIKFDCPVRDAELWVDDRFIAEIGHLGGGIALSPGAHRIEIRHDRYHAHYQEIAVKRRERRTLEVDLAERLP